MTDDIVNPDEHVMMVREIVDEVERVFYVIRDVHMDYWRSVHPINDQFAWTRDRRQRAEFDSRSEAQHELQAIWKWRRDQALGLIDEIPWESEAA